MFMRVSGGLNWHINIPGMIYDDLIWRNRGWWNPKVWQEGCRSWTVEHSENNCVSARMRSRVQSTTNDE